MQTKLLFLSLLVSVTAACGNKKDDAASPAPASGTAAPAPGTAPKQPDPPSKAITATAEGTACPAGTKLVTDATLTIDSTTASFVRSRGGGCPTKPVYTLLYTKASPTELRVCDDPGADMCEMFIQDEKVSFELAPVFAASGATAAVAGK